MNEKPIIVITGPTGSGKTALSIELAKLYKGEIISADSMMVYKHFDIGTDKITRMTNYESRIKNGTIEIDGIRHHLIDTKEPDEDFNAALFKQEAEKMIREIHDRGNIPFIVGGTLLYIDALVYNFQMPETTPDRQLRAELTDKTTEEIFSLLQKKYPKRAQAADRRNRHRLIRALETGDSKASRGTLPKNVLYLAIERNRQDLYSSVNRRVDEMMDSGLLEEVNHLKARYKKTKPFEGPGYKQLSEYIGKKISLETAVEETKQAHRNYAKRQLTWLRRNKDIRWVHDSKQASKLVADFIKKKRG